MSHLITLYILALLVYQKISSISQMSRFLETVSHDRLTDLLDGKWDGQTLLNSFAIRLLDRIDGFLILDDTVIPKPYSKRLEGFSYIYDHSQNKCVYGICVVLLAWTNGIIKLPIAYKVYKRDGLTRTELALDLISYARNSLKPKTVKGVFFDCWYSSNAILKRIRSYGWHFYTQVKSNRSFNKVKVASYKSGAFWHEVGMLSGNIKVLMIRHYQKFYISSKINTDWREVYNNYRIIRQSIEEIIKIVKSQLCLCFLSDRKSHHWDHHFALVFCSFIVLEKFSKDHGLSPYRMKEELICRRQLYEKALLDWISGFA